MSQSSSGASFQTDLSLQEIERQIADQRLPPVAHWQPERESSMDMVICRDGSWLYQGSRIQRDRMVRLFSTILRLDSDGRYALVTPAEKLIITVEDAPFIAVSITVFDAMEPAATVVFETNVGDKVILDDQHALWLEEDASGHPKPYLLVRDGLRALLSRSVYYQLVDACEQREDGIGIVSRGRFHLLSQECARSGNTTPSAK